MVCVGMWEDVPVYADLRICEIVSNEGEHGLPFLGIRAGHGDAGCISTYVLRRSLSYALLLYALSFSFFPALIDTP